jgi:AraC-like DNA-binding protein/mannose-6-phosphate isomerase-like protein (cupin superfamily)
MVRRRRGKAAKAERGDHQIALASIWNQEPLTRRETYEAPRTLLPEITIIGSITLQRAVPRALGPDRHPDEYELHIIRDGRMRLWIDSPKRVFELHGGMASLTQPQQLHSAEGELMLPGRWMWLRFRLPQGPRASTIGLTSSEAAAARRALAAVVPPVFHFSPTLEHCMERLIDEHRRPTPESPLAARGILHELIAWVVRDHRADQLRRTRDTGGAGGAGGEGSAGSAGEQSPAIAKVIAWLREHLQEDLSVTELANVAGLSPSYFRRCFHREIGSSPRDYVTQLRIEHAKRMLEATNRSITEIAMELGYNTSAYFTAVFHRETGTTPSDYRRQIKSAGAGARSGTAAMRNGGMEEA